MRGEQIVGGVPRRRGRDHERALPAVRADRRPSGGSIEVEGRHRREVRAVSRDPQLRTVVPTVELKGEIEAARAVRREARILGSVLVLLGLEKGLETDPRRTTRPRLLGRGDDVRARRRRASDDVRQPDIAPVARVTFVPGDERSLRPIGDHGDVIRDDRRPCVRCPDRPRRVARDLLPFGPAIARPRDRRESDAGRRAPGSRAGSNRATRCTRRLGRPARSAAARRDSRWSRRGSPRAGRSRSKREPRKEGRAGTARSRTTTSERASWPPGVDGPGTVVSWTGSLYSPRDQGYENRSRGPMTGARKEPQRPSPAWVALSFSPVAGPDPRASPPTPQAGSCCWRSSSCMSFALRAAWPAWQLLKKR